LLIFQVKPNIGACSSVSITYEQARVQGNFDVPTMNVEGQQQQQFRQSASHGFVASDADAGFVFHDDSPGESNASEKPQQQQQHFSPTKRKLGALNGYPMQPPSAKQEETISNGGGGGESKVPLMQPKALHQFSPLKLPILIPPQQLQQEQFLSLPVMNSNGVLNSNNLATNSETSGIDVNNSISRPSALLSLPKLQQPSNLQQPPITNQVIQSRFVRPPDDLKMEVENSSNHSNNNNLKSESKFPPPPLNSAVPSIAPPPTLSAPPIAPNAGQLNLLAPPPMTINPNLAHRKIVTAMRHSPPNLVPKIVAGPT
jgi:hypothetical protein